MNKRVMITGFGIISSIGNNCNEVLDSLINNRSGVVAVPEWGELGLKSCVAGTIKELDIEQIRQKIGMKSRYMDISSIYVTLAASEALAESGLQPEDLSSDRVGCVVGTGIANTDPISRSGLKINADTGKGTPYDITRCMSNSCSANLVNYYGIRGRSYSITSACATSLHNIGHGCELIWNGTCDIVMAGGAEEISSIITFMFNNMRTAITKSFNDDPEKASRPYDIKRDGFVISGGGGIVILEDLEHAKKRGATIYGEITGYGATSDGYDIIQPDPQADGAFRCINEALKMADCSPEEIDYINSHGTSTRAGDIAESIAIKKAFGEYKVPISSTKSHTGHGLGASGVHELIYCLLMMKHDFITASINIDELDPAFSNFDIVTENRDASLNRVLTNSFGFGGTNASLIIEKFNE